MAESIPTVFSVGDIAQRCHAPVHRVLYVIRTRDVRPTGKVGNHRFFTLADAERISSELRRIQRDRHDLGQPQ